jgi:hypothetical protein
VAELKIVKRTGKDSDGDITSLCGDGWTRSKLNAIAGDGWTRSKANAIADIDGRTVEYRVNSARGPLVDVIPGRTGKYLRSVADGRDPNNLDNLPDC